MKKNQSETEKNTRVMETLWLSYYNDTLFEKGLISEKERNTIRNMIKSRVSG